jgi:hypothetical protein
MRVTRIRAFLPTEVINLPSAKRWGRDMEYCSSQKKERIWGTVGDEFFFFSKKDGWGRIWGNLGDTLPYTNLDE